jgi:hypothetical protein
MWRGSAPAGRRSETDVVGLGLSVLIPMPRTTWYEPLE